MEWRPIETAPMDGTAVWLWCEGRAYIGYGDPADPLFDRPPTWFLKASFRRRDGETDDIIGCYAHGVQPTHWMPLPRPPEDPTP